MPRKNGLETLVAIKQHTELKHLPIIILTSSGAEREVVAAYGHHAITSSSGSISSSS